MAEWGPGTEGFGLIFFNEAAYYHAIIDCPLNDSDFTLGDKYLLSGYLVYLKNPINGEGIRHDIGTRVIVEELGKL